MSVALTDAMVDYSYHPVGCSEVPWALTSVLMALCAEVYVGGRTGWIDGSSHGHCLQSGRERWSTAACLGPGLRAVFVQEKDQPHPQVGPNVSFQC